MSDPRRTTSIAMLIVVLLLAACGGGGGGGGGAGGGGSDLPDAAKATSEDPEGTTYDLQEGRYRLSYQAPGCESVVIAITGADGTPIYDQKPRGFTSFVNDVPAGTYSIAVTSDCDEWTINLNKF
ncbi:MAG TPA: hypothetical protein VFN76_04600 [Candidatus Limnocylindria bacterium]|nr:hypothetical protein [Candidatus Limnocylindria bacterium]